MMKTPILSPAQPRLSDFRRRIPRRPVAFSLVEILIVTALLSVIILGLMAMFGQTQRAFRLGMTQSDVLEAGRAATELLGRELAQMRPSRISGTTNFFLWIPNNFTPLVQPLPGGSVGRTNVHMDLFFLTRADQRWSVIAYTVRDPDDVTLRPQGGVGTLYSYRVENRWGHDLPFQLSEFYAPGQTNLSRIADGIVHFRVRAFDTNGVWITDELPGHHQNSDVRVSTLVPGEIGYCALISNAVPAAVEIELGFLEPRVWGRARAIPNDDARRRYLEGQAGRVHLFRQRITVPAVDVLAYQ